MSVITKGRIFSNGEQLTAEKLNVLVDDASFDSSTAVDNSTTRVSASGAITVRPQGITSAELASSAVTLDKIRDLDSMKAIGNVTGSTAAPTQVDILDEDDMSSDSATSLATQQSIKAYVDDGNITKTTGTAPYYGCRAWGTYDGVSDVLNNNGNISGVSRTATGFYTVSFSTSMPNANYAVVIGSSAAGQLNTSYNSNIRVYDKLTGSFKLEVKGSGPSGGKSNQSEISFAIFA